MASYTVIFIHYKRLHIPSKIIWVPIVSSNLPVYLVPSGSSKTGVSSSRLRRKDAPGASLGRSWKFRTTWMDSSSSYMSYRREAGLVFVV